MSVSIPKQVKEFDDLVADEGKWVDTGRPSMKDFQEKRAAIRQDIVDEVLNQLKNRAFCVISGPRDSGKTWLCYAIGFELKRLRKGFSFVDLDDDFNAYDVWSYMKKWGRKTDNEFFFIVENCHVNKDEVRELVEYVSNDPENRRFIFTGVNTDALSILKEEACWIQIKTSEEEATTHVRNIIEKFIEINDVRKYVTVTDEEIKAAAEKWKDSDLRDVFMLLTEGWHFTDRKKLGEAEDKAAYKSMLDVNGKMKLGLSERRDIFLPLSAICQFESAQVWDQYLERINKQVLRVLENEGLIERKSWFGNFFLRIEAGKASWILKAIAYQKDPEDPKCQKGLECVRKEILKTFRDYVRQKPPNWSHVIYCARVSKGAPVLVKGIPYQVPPETKFPLVEPLKAWKGIPESVDEFLYSIFQDQETWKAIKEMVETGYFFSLSLLPSLSRTLIAAYQAEKEQDIVRILMQEEADRMLQELSSSRISALNHFLSFIWDRDRNRFFEVTRRIDVRDSKLARYKESTVQKKRELCFLISYANMPMSKLIVEDMQKQLKESAADSIRRVVDGFAHQMRRIVGSEEFFESFQTSDWENIIRNSSTIIPIFHLLRSDFKHRGLRKAAVSFSQAFVKSDLKDLVSQKGAGLYALAGIIDEAHDLNVETKTLVESILCADYDILKSLYLNEKKREARWVAEKERLTAVEREYKIPKGAFMQGLTRIAINASEHAETDLGINQKIASLLDTLAKFEASDLRDMFRDIKSVNYFFPHLASKAPKACRSIMKKIGFDVWLGLIQSTLRDEKMEKQQAFWLLWNIFRYDESLAKKLAKKSTHIFLENAKKSRLSEISLPLTGLLNHLKVGIDDSLRIDFETASGTLESFVGRKPPGYATMILLSFIALSSKAPREKFDALKEKVMKDPDVKSCLYSNLDIQLQSVFTNLIRKYRF